MTLSFRATEWINTGTRGWVAIVKPSTKLTQEEADSLFGGTVRIDLQEYRVKAIERFAIFGWYHFQFGIFIEGAPKGMGIPLNSVAA